MKCCVVCRDPMEIATTKIPIYKMRKIGCRVFKRDCGTSTYTPMAAKRVIIDLTEDAEDDIDSMLQMTGRSRTLMSRQLRAGIQLDTTPCSASSVENVAGGSVESSGSVDSEQNLGYVPVEGCLRAQFEAWDAQIKQAAADGRQGKPVKTIRLTSSKARMEKWSQNGNPNDYFVLKVKPQISTATFEIVALRKNLSMVQEAYSQTQLELIRLQRLIDRQLADLEVRRARAMAKWAQEEAEAKKAEQLKKEARAGAEDMEQTSTSQQPNQKKLPVKIIFRNWTNPF